jgi:hypothetical protein
LERIARNAMSAGLYVNDLTASRIFKDGLLLK